MLNLLNEDERITVLDLNQIITQKQPFLLIDVRNNIEYDMCHLPFSINIQLSDLKTNNTLSDLIERINSFKLLNTTPNCK